MPHPLPPCHIFPVSISEGEWTILEPALNQCGTLKHEVLSSSLSITYASVMLCSLIEQSKEEGRKSRRSKTWALVGVLLPTGPRHYRGVTGGERARGWGMVRQGRAWMVVDMHILLPRVPGAMGKTATNGCSQTVGVGVREEAETARFQREINAVRVDTSSKELCCEESRIPQGQERVGSPD